MVSDMKDWCNQPRQICSKCHNIGIYMIKNVTQPWVGDVPIYCNCGIGKSLKERNSTPPPLPRKWWDTIWMNLAKDIATKSTCKVPNRQVGCVIVSDDNTKVLAIGYNGSAKGDDNSCDYDVGSENKVGNSRCTCIHAEMNSLVKLDTSNPCKKRMYLTLSPCDLCYKLIVNAGINEVIYSSEYNSSTIEKLNTLGVKIRKYEDNRDK